MIQPKQLPYFINCPYCNQQIEIITYACRIYRHGYYKKTMKQIGQHCKERTVECLLKKDKIYGCGRQFRINGDNTIDKTTGL